MKKNYFYVVLIAILVQTSLYAQETEDFITTWETTTDDEIIKLPLRTSPSTSFQIDWGDGTVNSNTLKHLYFEKGKHIITIQSTGPYAILFFNSQHKHKILSVDQWGKNKWPTMYRAFYGCKNLVINAQDTPNLLSVKDMGFMFYEAASLGKGNGNWSWNTENIKFMDKMFYGAEKFNQNISSWKTENVEDMSSMFAAAFSFNQNIGNWDTTKVTSMSSMFQWANQFNQNIGGWKTGNVKDMSSMFAYAENFNRYIGDWYTNNVENMSSMFEWATKFNQSIGDWYTSNVTDMSKMFYYSFNFNRRIKNWDIRKVTNMKLMFSEAISFNQDISGWKTNTVKNMYGMFKNATKFNQNLENWNVENVTSSHDMLRNTNLSTPNYDALLISWNTQTLKHNNYFSAYPTKYSSPHAAAARTNMISHSSSGHKWIISDGGLAPSVARTSSEDIEEDVSNVLDIYKTNNKSLRVVGLEKGSASVRIINILGMQVLSQSFQAKSIEDISLVALNKGIYIVHVKTADKRLTEKILIE